MTPLTTTNNSLMSIHPQKQFAQLVCDGPQPQNQIGMMPACAAPPPKRETLHLNHQQKELAIKAPT